MIPKNKASKAKERARVGVEVWGLWVGWAGVGEVGHPPPIGLVQLRHCPAPGNCAVQLLQSALNSRHQTVRVHYGGRKPLPL